MELGTTRPRRALILTVWLVSRSAIAVAQPAAAPAPPEAPATAPAEVAAPDTSTRSVEALAADARRLYADEKYSEAVGKYLTAYRLAPTAALLYNIAFIYDRKLDEAELAADFYRRYIRSPDAEPDAVQRATERLRELAAVRARTEPRLDAEPPPTTALPPPASDPSVPAPGVVARRAPPRGMTPQAIWGWAVLGSGLAVAATGTVFDVLALQSERAFAESDTLGTKQRLRDRGKAEALAGDVLVGLGAAAVVTGVVLLLTDPGPRESASTGAPTLRVGATPLPSGGAVWLGGAL